MEKPTNDNRIHRGQIVYLVVSRRRVREVRVCRCDGELYTVCFTDKPGAVRLRRDRLYLTREEAERDLGQGRRPGAPPEEKPSFLWHNVPLWQL